MVHPSFSGISENFYNLFPVKRIKRLQIAYHLLKIKTPWYLLALQPNLGEFTHHQLYDLLPFNNISNSQEALFADFSPNPRRR